MNSAEALGELRRMGDPVMETREVAARLALSISGASHLLRSLASAGLAQKVRRGLWAFVPDLDPLRVPPYLTAPMPAYVSLWSALSHHGMIQQVPGRISVVSTGRTRSVPTAVGLFSIHHIAPELFGGFTGSVDTGYVATPEKAMFDTVYVRTPSGGATFMPELELPEGFDSVDLLSWVDQISSPRLRTIVGRTLEDLVDTRP